MPTIQELDAKYGIQGGTSTPPLPAGSAPDQAPGFWNAAERALPAIGGTAGAIGGSLLGGPVGGVAGAGLGGVTGKSIENIINFFRGEKQTPQGNLASGVTAGAEQAPWGLLGGEGVIENPLLRAGARFGLGSLIGGGEKAWSNVKDKKPIGEGVLATGGITGGVNTLLGGGFDILGGQASGLQKDINKSLVEAPQAQLQATYNDAMDSAFGHMNRDYAVNEGIAPSLDSLSSKVKDEGILNSKTITDMMTKRSDKATQIEEQLQTVLSGKPVAQSEVDVLRSQLKDAFNVSDTASNPTLTKKLLKMVNGKSIDNLQDINSLKRAIGDYWDSDNPGVANKLYSTLQEYIQNHGGPAVQGLNTEAKQLVDMGFKLRKLSYETNLPVGQSAAEITKKLTEGKIKQTPRMIALQGGAGLLGGASSMALLQAITQNVGISGSGGMGGMFLGRSIGQKLMENPQTLQALSDWLSSASPKVIKQLVEQLGVRNADKLLGQ
jgi:hypothetical protein